MRKIAVLGANGQIARLFEEQILNAPQFSDVELTLFLRNKSRLENLENNPQVKLIEGDIRNEEEVFEALKDQDFIFVATVDHESDNSITKNVIHAMKSNGKGRVAVANVLGIYDEVPGAFGQWNAEQIGPKGLATARNSDQLLAESGVKYTTLRLPWLNDRDEIKYSITTRNEIYNGVSVSRKSVAEFILKLIDDPNLYVKESIGIADPDTQGENRPVY
ncbi:NAD(P)H-binding protein [Xylocopilactobacillus apis]|uniref:Saccharopine dehydrogenase n=1 Tax=Xylocopilactobacillus apis TaxID=2932183 RepID=A0AAU9D3D9_9LACO|nr:NAD(P)H-binding protein [Xylocopilactobacillus apis]BDR56810.1 saccharopine dehydrogenase [Xylocopilactobacillus apis]